MGIPLETIFKILTHCYGIRLCCRERNTDQNVYITASFPAVNSRVEIEEALSNLVNRASQYAFNTRK